MNPIVVSIIFLLIGYGIGLLHLTSREIRSYAEGYCAGMKDAIEEQIESELPRDDEKVSKVIGTWL